LRSELGLLEGDLDTELTDAAAERDSVLALAVERGLLDEGEADVDRQVEALHRLIAASPSALLGISLADVTGERRSQNQPGTVDEYPNWRVPLADARGKVVLVEDLVDHDGFARLARAVSGDTSPVE